MQGICHTNGSQACMESHKVLSVVSSDVDILIVHADPSKCNHDRLEKSR